MIDPNRTTHSAQITPFKHPAFPDPPAVVKFDPSPEFKQGVDSTVMVRSEGGSSAVSFSELQQAVRDHGGTASGEQVARALSHRVRGDSFMTFSDLPPGLTHPVVDYVFKQVGDGLTVSYQEVKTAPIIAPEDGNIATVDLFGTGQSSPESGSMLMLHAYTSDGSELQNMVGLEALKSVVQASGGQVSANDTAALKPLAGPMAAMSGKEITHVEITENPQHISDYEGVKRTFRLDEQGQLVVDYRQDRRR